MPYKMFNNFLLHNINRKIIYLPFNTNNIIQRPANYEQFVQCINIQHDRDYVVVYDVRGSPSFD